MREAQHEAIARWERRWLAVSGVMLALFVILMAYSLTIEGQHIAQPSDHGTPEQILQRDMFANPGVVQTGPDAYRASLTAQAFSFAPAEIVLPAGAETTFYLTSTDVLHGFQVQDTSINVELIPGEIATLRYTFDEPGSYRVACNEYCGIGHHDMMGTITVLEPRAYAARMRQREAAPERSGPMAQTLATGEEAYAANCAGCHGANGLGTPGVFPPLQGHARDLFAAEGGREYLAQVLIYGLEGPIEVDGTTYDGSMPAWPQLSDAQLAGVANFVVAGWEDAAGMPDDADPYTPEELEALRGRGLSPADVFDARQALELEP